MKYSEEFKKSAVEKFLMRGNRSVSEIAQEMGIHIPTLYDWRNKFAKVGDMKKISKPQSRSAIEKFKAVTEYSMLSTDKRGEYLRTNGIHEENISEWQKQIEEALSPKKKTFQENFQQQADQKKIKNLEKELLRKDKALAEASALLILKKKAELIWGLEEDE